MVYKDGVLRDSGQQLAKGKYIEGMVFSSGVLSPIHFLRALLFKPAVNFRIPSTPIAVELKLFTKLSLDKPVSPIILSSYFAKMVAYSKNYFPILAKNFSCLRVSKYDSFSFPFHQTAFAVCINDNFFSQCV